MLDTSHFVLGLLAIFALVFANGFFVAAEFALVTVRKTRIDQLAAEGHRGARTVRRALSDPDSYIAATQLGITMASLGLGWVGEPALAGSIEPLFHFLGPYMAAGHGAFGRRAIPSSSSPPCTSCWASSRRRPSPFSISEPWRCWSRSPPSCSCGSAGRSSAC